VVGDRRHHALNGRTFASEQVVQEGIEAFCRVAMDQRFSDSVLHGIHAEPDRKKAVNHDCSDCPRPKTTRSPGEFPHRGF
jgi:hypothetical protein